MAEIKKEPLFCEKITNPDGKIICLAKVTRKIEPCYSLSKDKDDQSRYARAVQYCLGDVALRTGQLEICQKIDGPDYGEQWRIGRNDCLMNAGWYLQKTGKDPGTVCKHMVDDEPGWHMKEACTQGKIPKICDYDFPL